MRLSEYIHSIRDKKITVIGIGVSNLPLIEMLLENGCDVTARDKNSCERLGETASHLAALGARLICGDGYLSDIQTDIIFRTPGLHPDKLQEAVAHGAVLTSEMEIFFEVCPCTIIAVTGSDGKTTTTSIIAELLKSEGYAVHVGGNIGTPLLRDVDHFQPQDVAVLELSSFQLLTMKKSPHIAVVTNLSPNHLDVHRDMDEYVEAKKNIFRYQRPGDILVLNYDNEYTRSFAPLAEGEVRFFSRRAAMHNGAFSDGKTLFAASDGVVSPLVDVNDIFLRGVHNQENYLAAFLAARDMISYDAFRKVAREFTGVEHRIEFVREKDGVWYYNDSIASSPSRTIAGLNSFDQKVILIAGGKDKNIPYDALGPEIIAHVKRLILTGETSEKIKDAVIAAKEYGGSPEITVVDGFRDAVLLASQLASSGDIVILSPASTSFDRFKNFEERGKVFKDIINGLE